MNPRPLGYEPRRQCSTEPGSGWSQTAQFSVASLAADRAALSRLLRAVKRGAADSMAGAGSPRSLPRYARSARTPRMSCSFHRPGAPRAHWTTGLRHKPEGHVRHRAWQPHRGACPCQLQQRTVAARSRSRSNQPRNRRSAISHRQRTVHPCAASATARPEPPPWPTARQQCQPCHEPGGSHPHPHKASQAPRSRRRYSTVFADELGQRRPRARTPTCALGLLARRAGVPITGLGQQAGLVQAFAQARRAWPGWSDWSWTATPISIRPGAAAHAATKAAPSMFLPAWG